MFWLGVLAVLSSTRAVHGILNATSVIVEPDGWSVYPCLQLNYRLQDLDPSVMGHWYVIEIIQHREDPRHRTSQVAEICPKLNLFKNGKEDVRLTWQEKSGEVFYNFKMSDPENRGFWISWGKQSGSMLNKDYAQFAGSVQVMEAQPSRMVLTFCSYQRSHFSLVMVRNISVTHDTMMVHQTLSMYGLPDLAVRQTCRDASQVPGSATNSAPALAIVLSTLLLLVYRLN